MTPSKKKRPRRRTSAERPRRYEGLLNQPNTIQIAELLAGAGRPLWYPGTEQEWNAVVARLRKREAREWRRRHQALADFYDITLDRDPDVSDCWHKMAIALASAHVPAFARGSLTSGTDEPRAKAVGRRPVQLRNHSTEIFAMLVCLALQEGLTTRHRIARYVSENATKFHMMKVWKPKVSKDFGSALRSIPFETAKYLVPQLCSAWRDVCRGKATTFQYQVVAVAIQPRSSPPNVARVWQWVFGLHPKASKSNVRAAPRSKL